MKQFRTVPHDPQPIAPREGEVVDGHHVILRWENEEAARRYCVQIAATSDFKSVEFEQEVPAGTTALAVRRHFPDDDRVYYWRVLAGNAEGWSEGDHIEAFTSGTADQVGRFAVPDVAEPFGPVAALFSTATLESVAELVPGHQPRIERTLGDEHPEGVEAAEMVSIGLGLYAAAAFVIISLVVVLFAAC
jgi:hypothetical protein